MKNKKITYAVYLDTDTNRLETVLFEENNVKDLLHAQDVKVMRRSIGNQPYYILCRDTGMFRVTEPVSGVNESGVPMLYGPLLILKDNGNEEPGFTYNEAQAVRKNAACQVVSISHKKPHYVITNVAFA